MDDDDTGFTCYWRIENFVLFKKNSNFVLLSPKFKSARLASYFCLKIQEYEKSSIAIYLLKVRRPPNGYFFEVKYVYITFSVSLLLKTGWVSVVENVRHQFVTDISSWGVDKLVNWEKIEQDPWTYLPNGCLTIKFHMWNQHTRNSCVQRLIVSKMLNEKELSNMPIQTFETFKQGDLMYFPSSYKFKNENKTKGTQTDAPEEESTLQNQDSILRFFQEKKLCFVNLKTSYKEFMVHKALLCAASPVFKAMFEQDMQENVKNIVYIEDIDDETMTAFIQFLHMDSTGDLNWEKTVKLYYVADKYQIEILKKKCTFLLKEKLTPQNICEAFILADLHQNHDLKQSAVNCFVQNSMTILRSEEWKNFLLNQTILAAEILHNSADVLYQAKKP